MSIKNILSKKVAVLIAAFFMVETQNSFAKENIETYDELVKTTTQLLVKKQKTEALLMINKFIKNDVNKARSVEANELITKVSQTFLSKEAQDAYEGSINATLDAAKEAQRLVDLCLQIEPENLDCLVQKIRLSYREKNRYLTEKYIKIMADFAKGTTIYSWVEAILQKDVSGSGFKEKSFVKKFAEKPSEEMFALTVLEIDRSFQAKNFSRARSGIESLEKAFPDYPENVYFKQRLDMDSSEEKNPVGNEGSIIYQSKCKSLTKSMARKFRYDFELCQRGLQ